MPPVSASKTAAMVLCRCVGRPSAINTGTEAATAVVFGPQNLLPRR